MSLQRSPPPNLPEPGTVIAGKYEVERVLGHGGMGVVVAAKHLALKQRVAIKFLLPASMELPEAPARFLREAQAAAAIQSEHVARVLDVGTLDSGEPYMVMEHLAGEDLGVLFKARGKLPIVEAIDMVLEACEALAEAHALGIVHRDIKPGNLFVTRRADGSPMVKVLDFGLSKALAERAGGESSLTSSTAVVGSPLYMSPEQLRSLKNVDTRTDIWSLGVILYMLLAGRRPYDGDTMTAVCAAIISETPATLSELRPEVPPALDALVLRCLEKDLPRRVQSVSELARGLAPFGSAKAHLSMERIVKVLAGHDGGPSKGPPNPPGHDGGPPGEGRHADTHPNPRSGSSESEAASSWGQTGALPGRRRTLAIGGAVGVLLLGGLALALRSMSAAPATVATAGSGPLSAPTVEIQSPLRVPPAEPRSAEPSPTPAAAASGDHAATSASAPTGPKAAAPAKAPGPAAPKPPAATTVPPAAKPSADPMERWN